MSYGYKVAGAEDLISVLIRGIEEGTCGILKINKGERMRSEYDEVKEILERHGITSVDDIGYGDECYDDLYDYYANSGEMPYGVMKARTGMPDEWIVDRIIDLDIIEEMA